MKTFRLENKTVSENVLVSVVCDWCGDAVHNTQPTINEAWVGIHYNDVDVEFKLSYEISESDGYDWVGTRGFEVEDLCPQCAKDLQNLLTNAGITVKEIKRY